MDYEQEMYIDHEALDIEWLEQPRLMMKLSKKTAEAEKDVDILKEELGIIKSDLDKDIRLNLKKYKLHKLEKITESIILSTIQSDAQYRALKTQVIEAEFEKNMASGAVRSAGHRKDALENLVRLFGMHYFAGPSVPRDLNAESLKRKKEEVIDNSVKLKKYKKKKKK